jgi:hypothetical protein
MASADFDPDMYTKMLNLTEPYHRSAYPSVSSTNPSISFAGKVVLVTGASRGVGFGIAPVFAEAGAAGVVVTARQVSSLETVTAAIKEKNAKTEVLALACDVSDSEAVKKVFSEIKEKFGRLDLVVANAGVMSQGETFPKIGDEATLKVWTADIVCFPFFTSTSISLKISTNWWQPEYKYLRHLLHRPALYLTLRSYWCLPLPHLWSRSPHHPRNVLLRHQ